MTKDKIKKLFKCMLCASMLLTGFILNPVKANAEEVGTYASTTRIETHSVTVKDPIDEGFDLKIYYKLRRTTTSLEVMLNFDSFSSTSITSGYTFAPSKAMSATGYSSSIDANKTLKITYAVKTYKNGAYLGTVDITITYKLNGSPNVTVG